MNTFSEHGTVGSIWIALAVAVAYAALGQARSPGKPERTWRYSLGCVVFLSLNVLRQRVFQFPYFGERPPVPELDLVLILGMVTSLPPVESPGRGAARRGCR